MKSKRVVTTFLVVVAALAVGATGCKKGNKSGAKGQASSSKAGSSTSASASAAANPKLIAIFPKDSEVLFGINVAALRQSSIWKTYAKQIKASIAKDKSMAAMQQKCGLDIVSSVNSVLVGGSSAGKNDMAVIINGINRAKLKSCIAKIGTIGTDKVSITSDGKFDHITKGSDKALIGWLDGNTAVIRSGDKVQTDETWLKTRMAGANGLNTNQDFMKLVGQVDTKADMWLAMIPAANSPMGMGMGMSGGPKPKAMYGSVHLSKGLNLHLGVRFASADQAKKMVTQAQAMMQMVQSNPKFGKYVSKVKMSTKGNDAIVQLNLSQQDLSDLGKTIESGVGSMLLGGMTGGAGAAPGAGSK